MRGFAALLLRGMRWRLGTSILTVVTSAIAVGAAVLGPLYLQTASDSVVRTTVRSAPIEARGATVSAPAGEVTSLGQIKRGEQVLEEAGGLHRWYGTPLTSVLVGVGLAAPDRSPLQSTLFSRTGICNQLRFREGSCDLASGDVALSDRSARELGVSLGAVLPATVQGRSKALRVRVTGIYSVPSLSRAYWWGNGPGYFPFGQTSGPNHIPEIDPLIASPATALSVPAQAVPEVVGQVPLRPGSVGVDDEGALQRALSRASGAIAPNGILLTSELSALLAGAGRQRHVMSTIVLIAAVQLVLLAIWVLVSLLVRSSDARQSEARVARLRGFPAASMFAVTAAEPVALCLCGAVLGVAAAWASVLVARDRLLDPSAAISPDLWVFVALAIVVVAITGALGVGMVRLLRSSGFSGGRAQGAGHLTSLVVDAVLLVLSLVALVALATSGNLAGQGNPIASAAPGLIALGAAVVAVRLVLFACRLGVSASAFSQSVATFLALRLIVRRPVIVRHARVLIIALGLACFAAAAWSVARANRATAATFSVGTSAVVSVTPQGVGLERALDRVDPGGRYAMAAIAVRTQSSDLLAVDARRLPVAVSWPAGISRSTLSATRRAIDPSTAPEVTLAGAPIQLVATTTAGPPLAAGLAHLDLDLWVFSGQVGTSIVDLGALHSGARTYRASLLRACPGGCRLAGLGLVPAPGHQVPASGRVDLDVSRVSTGSPPGASAAVPADLFAHGWRPTAPGVRVGMGASGGLTFAIPASAASADVGAAGAITPPMAAPADHPAVLPGAVTSEVQSINGSTALRAPIPAQGLDGNSVSVSPAVTVSALPRMGIDAVMVDLDLLTRSQVSPTTAFASDQVWLGPAAPRDVLARLQAAGLSVDGVQRASAAFRQMQRSGPALADDFLLAATVAALLVAAASTLGALGATTRQRATELTALEVGGVRRRVLARSLAVESAVLAGTALFGAGAGVLAALLAIPSLPELAAPAVIPLQYALPGILIAAVSAAVIGVVLVAGVAMAAVLVHRMSPLLLRTATNDSTG